MIKKYIVYFILLVQLSCSLNKIDYIHGTSNLKYKTESLKIKNNNKNDVLSIFGPSLIENNIENKWSYFEVRETYKWGKRTIYTNNYTIIYFDKYGIVNKIDFYDLNNLNKITFTESKTVSKGVKDTFVKNILNSTRKRIESAQKKF